MFLHSEGFGVSSMKTALRWPGGLPRRTFCRVGRSTAMISEYGLFQNKCAKSDKTRECTSWRSTKKSQQIERRNANEFLHRSLSLIAAFPLLHIHLYDFFERTAPSLPSKRFRLFNPPLERHLAHHIPRVGTSNFIALLSAHSLSRSLPFSLKPLTVTGKVSLSMIMTERWFHRVEARQSSRELNSSMFASAAWQVIWKYRARWPLCC